MRIPEISFRWRPFMFFRELVQKHLLRRNRHSLQLLAVFGIYGFRAAAGGHEGDAIGFRESGYHGVGSRKMMRYPAVGARNLWRRLAGCAIGMRRAHWLIRIPHKAFGPEQWFS